MKLAPSFSWNLLLVGLVFCALPTACVSQDVDQIIAANRKSKAELSPSGAALSSSETTGQCPSGTRFNAFPRVCVTRGGFALGPFPLALQEICRDKSPDDASTCVQKQDWPFELLMSLTSSYKQGCPPGTSPGKNGVCIGSDNIYGPFTLQQIMACRAALPEIQQSQCDEIVWPPDFLKYANEESPAAAKSTVVDEKPVDQSTAGKDANTAAPPEIIVLDAAPAQTPPQPLKEAKAPAAEAPQPLKETKAPAAEAPQPPTFCVHSWDERPGTADFTTINRRLRSMNLPQSYPLDRTEDSALLGNKDFQSLDMCGRARFLKGCFYQVVYDSQSPAAQTFRSWATGRLRPVEAFMAFAMTQTRLGLWHDECWQGQCRGVGLVQVKRALSAAGRRIALHDPAWQGITHNMLTNLRFGLRLIAARAAVGSSDLYQLAYSFAESSGRKERFAQDVEKYYRQLVSCQLD